MRRWVQGVEQDVSARDDPSLLAVLDAVEDVVVGAGQPERIPEARPSLGGGLPAAKPVPASWTRRVRVERVDGGSLARVPLPKTGLCVVAAVNRRWISRSRLVTHERRSGTGADPILGLEDKRVGDILQR